MEKLIKISVRSRNYSCAPLKELAFPIKVIFRMGSITPTNLITKRKKVLEINTVKGCALSSDKIAMKKRFTRSNIETAPWFTVKAGDRDGERVAHYLKKWPKIIAKHKHSSKGNGIFLITSMEDFKDFREGLAKQPAYLRNIEDYVFERYYTYTKEYRLHVTKNGCFHASRKMLVADAQDRWHRHAENSIFVREDNEMFAKPKSWDDIVQACVNALKALELDVASFDVKVQNDTNEYPKFIILESNTASALGEETAEKYKNILNTLVYERI